MGGGLGMPHAIARQRCDEKDGPERGNNFLPAIINPHLPPSRPAAYITIVGIASAIAMVAAIAADVVVVLKLVKKPQTGSSQTAMA